MADVTNQMGQNMGITPTTQQWSDLRKDYRASQPWARRNPGAAASVGIGGSALAGLLSGLMSGGGFWGKKAQTNQVPLYGQQTMNMMSGLPSQLISQLMGDQFDFGPIEDLARQNFQSKTIPSLMNRFNMGGNRGSGAEQGALAAAGSGLDAQLAAMRQGYGRQRQEMLAGLFGQSLRPTFENVRSPEKAGAGDQMMQAIMTALPRVLKAL